MSTQVNDFDNNVLIKSKVTAKVYFQFNDEEPILSANLIDDQNFRLELKNAPNSFCEFKSKDGTKFKIYVEQIND